MKILDVLTSPWAIAPEKLSEIRSVYHTHLRGPKIDWKAMESSFLTFVGEEPEKREPYEVRDGVAIIDISGVLTKGLSLFSFLFGGASMRQIGEAVRLAVDDPAASSILLYIDSPGGTVDGTQELASIVFAARSAKPIIAFSDGEICSAAYWIGSAAGRVFISGDTVAVGSIGVVATHIDQSKFDEQMGDKYTEIVAGKYKRIASAHKPLSKEGAEYIQERVDHVYSVFVGEVAKQRGVSEEAALAMADGKIFLGQQAIDIGLVDGVSTFDELIAGMAAGDVAGLQSDRKDSTMKNLQELKEKFPALYQEAFDAGKAEGSAEIAVTMAKELETRITAEASAVERKRIMDIQAVIIPGHEKIAADAIADGKSTAGEVAVKIVAAEKGIREAKLKALEEDGKKPAEVVAAGAQTVDKTEKTAKTASEAGDVLDKIAKEIVAKDKASYSAAFAKACKDNPKLAAVYNTGKEA